MKLREHIQGDRSNSKRAQCAGSQEKTVYQRRRCDLLRHQPRDLASEFYSLEIIGDSDKSNLVERHNCRVFCMTFNEKLKCFFSFMVDTLSIDLSLHINLLHMPSRYIFGCYWTTCIHKCHCLNEIGIFRSVSLTV